MVSGYEQLVFLHGQLLNQMNRIEDDSKQQPQLKCWKPESKMIKLVTISKSYSFRVEAQDNQVLSI